MKKWTLLDKASTPDGSEMSLWEHDGTYTIRVGGAELMSTRKHASEDSLARLGCRRLTGKGHGRANGKHRGRVLIGGLGFGFTLKACLAELGPGASVTIAELMPEIARWNQDERYPLARSSLADPRVRLVIGDVLGLMDKSKGAFDAILLDVDNGPSAFTDTANAALYGPQGIATAKNALSHGGELAVWSHAYDKSYETALKKAGFTVEIHKARAHESSGPFHTIYLAHVS